MSSTVPPGLDPGAYDRRRRRILWLMPSGLYVIGTRADARRNLMTVSWVTQVSLEPKAIGVGVEHTARTRELLVESGVFALSLVQRAERAVVRKFVKPVEDVEMDEETGSGTMNGIRVMSSTSGAPVLAGCVAFLDCRVRHVLELGSHDWFVGEVVDCGYGSGHPRGDEAAQASDPEPEVLRMEDTRMNYGG